jgi:hypothetical protein
MPREKVPGPPVKWRPRDLTMREKLEIVVRQKGFEPDGRTRLRPLEDGVQFDHVPALQRRRWDPETEDTIPPACDLAYIVALNKATHAVKTAKSDVPEIAKTRRLEKKRQTAAAGIEPARTERNGWERKRTAWNSSERNGTEDTTCYSMLLNDTEREPVRVANKDSKDNKDNNAKRKIGSFNPKSNGPKPFKSKSEWPKRKFPSRKT